MKSKITLFLTLFVTFVGVAAHADQPLRVFIRAGAKTHGPGQHDHPQFLKEWKDLLNARGAKADGSLEFPTATQLDATDVMIMFCADGGVVTPPQREILDKFLNRGGGLVVIHDAVVSGSDADWFKTIIGGAWQDGKAQWLEGPESFYIVDREHPITKGVSNFDLDDEIYYDLNMLPEARVLGAVYTPNTPNTPKGTKLRGQHPSVFDIQPQMWVYEKDSYRAFVSIIGHQHKSFSLPHYRALLLRAIAWAGKRDNVDLLCTKDELAALRYPVGGPSLPTKTMAETVVHPDFKMNLVATEPLINKPMAMDWDAQGRLWVAESPEYPNGRRLPRNEVWKESGSLVRTGDIANRPATDRISILSDPDEHGAMRKKSIFYEGLECVSTFVFYKDGVIVGQAPDILWIRDTDGDGKADKVEKLYTGFNTGDTHFVLNHFAWGFDGWIYATVGSGGEIFNGDKTKKLANIGSGLMRFKPDGSAVELVSSKGGNTWGTGISWDNELFFTQATSGDLLNHVVLTENVLSRGKVGNVESYKSIVRGRKSFPLMTYEHQAYVQIDQVGFFTAACGCAIYGGGAWPAEWNYGYFVAEPTINIIHHETLKPDGVTFAASKVPDRAEMEFIAGRDYWWRPISTKIGRDGALYLVDFYNQAVIHNDTRGPAHGPAGAAIRPDRDHYFGRLWRVQHKDAKKLDVPNLANAKSADLVKALEHPNLTTRLIAHRLLCERADVSVVPALITLAKSRQPSYARVHALWILRNTGHLDAALLVAAIDDADAAIRKNALKIAAEQPPAATAVLAHASNDPDPRARLEAIVALGSQPVTTEITTVLLAAYPDLKDPWLESAAAGVAAKAPGEFLAAALSANNPGALASLVAALSSHVSVEQAGPVVIRVAAAPAAADGLKQIVLDTLVRSLAPAAMPAMSAELQKALVALLSSPNGNLVTAALPLVARWDKSGALANDVQGLVQQLTAKLNDAAQPDESRTQIATTLLAVRQLSPAIVPAVGQLLGTSASPKLKQQIIRALGDTSEPAVGVQLVAAYPALDAALQALAFDELLKRVDWALALLAALDAGKINDATLGPSQLHWLRTHANRVVAKRANEWLDRVRGPELKEKNELIAKFAPIVQQPGDVNNGKALFTKNCAVCHRIGNEGKDVGPNLTGIGAHGATVLLVSVLDPNREVDPSFFAWNIETKEGETLTGVIARENRTSLMLKNATGELEIKLSDIKSRRQSGLSLMPNGFEALGTDGVRDVLAYVCSTEGRFRYLDLAPAFTADTRKGLYQSEENLNDTFHFPKFGSVNVEGVPFWVVDPTRSANGNNVMVLKGGGNGSFSKTLPQRVEAKVGFGATKLHFLGGVAGWGWPAVREEVPALKVTVHYAGGESEEFVAKNGQEIADYIGVVDVPGSKLARGVVSDHQLRWFSRPLKSRAVIERIVFESNDNGVAPTTMAITAELTDSGASPAAPPPSPSPVPTPVSAPSVPKPPASAKGLRVLLVGGGSSHDFNKWFNEADRATLAALKPGWLEYTDIVGGVGEALGNVDVLGWSANQSVPTETSKALLNFAAAGKGLVIIHPGVWYNWGNFPEWNSQICGGGSRGHDRFGEFEVVVTDPKHPLMAGVPEKFKISDELYHFEPDPKGAPIQVLATATSPLDGKTFPMVWIVKHPQARIVCIALGHDGQAHDHAAYKQLLQNAVKWAAAK